jgi:hypothetical protein
MGQWKTAAAGLALWLGLAGQVGIVAAEGETAPPRVVLVQTAGVGAERQTTIISSSNPTARVVPSRGTLAGGEAVLGQRVARPAPAATPSGDMLGGAISTIADNVLGPVEPGTGPDGAEAAAPAPRPSRATSTGAEAAAASAARPSWQRSVLDDPPVSTEQRLASMQGANRRPPAGLPVWQLGLLALMGLAGLGGAVYGMIWLVRPRYVVRVVPAPVRPASRPARPLVGRVAPRSPGRPRTSRTPVPAWRSGT